MAAAEAELHDNERNVAGLRKERGRRKEPLAPGFGLMGWIKLTQSGKDLAGTQGKRLKVKPSELRIHCTVEDCWTVVNGTVYNITEYLPYHPGGVEELMRGAGKDCTKLFNHKHGWVNIQALLEKCIVGVLIPEDF